MKALAALGLVLLLAGCGLIRIPPPGGASDAAVGPTLEGRPARPSAAGDGVLVQRGDTLHAIARQNNVSLRGMIEVNQLQPPYRLQVGQKLLLPSERTHIVQSGETLSGVAARYGVEGAALAQANGLEPTSGLRIGQILVLHDRSAAAGGAVVRASAPPPPAGSPRAVVAETLAPPPSDPPAPGDPVPAPAPVTSGLPPGGEVSIAALPPEAPVAAPPAEPGRGSGQFLRPIEGTLLSTYGPKPGGMHNDGINIAAPQGAPVRAAERGVVVYAGNELRGYGNLILLRHDQGWVSAYAHGETMLVRRGETVERGQVIARVGNTGGVDQPQLHFELRRGTRAVDPMPLMTASSPT